MTPPLTRGLANVPLLSQSKVSVVIEDGSGANICFGTRAGCGQPISAHCKCVIKMSSGLIQMTGGLHDHADVV